MLHGFNKSAGFLLARIIVYNDTIGFNGKSKKGNFVKGGGISTY